MFILRICYTRRGQRQRFFASNLVIRQASRFHNHSHSHSHGQSHVHGHSHSPTAARKLSEVEDKAANRLTWIGLFSDIGLFGVKGVIGYLSGSAALIADALHSGSDLVSGFVTLASLKLSRKAPDKHHPYGYGHYETLGTLGVSSLLLAGSASGVYYSINHLILASGFDPGHVLEMNQVPAALITCAVSVIVKEGLYWVTKREGQKQNSTVLIANAWHHRSDSMSSFAAFFGITGFALGFPLIDPLLGIAVGGLVLKTAVELAWTAIADLTDRQRTDDMYLIEKAVKIGDELRVETEGEVQDVHNVKCRRIGNYLLMDVHVAVDPSLTVTAAFHAASKVKQRILKDLPEIRDISTHIQAHPPFSKPGSSLHGLKPHSELKSSLSIPGEVSAMNTRTQHEIERDVRTAVERLQILGVSGVSGLSHCSVHHQISEINPSSGERSLKTVVEANLKMDDSLTLSQAKKAALAAKEQILLIPDVHDADLHIEIL